MKNPKINLNFNKNDLEQDKIINNLVDKLCKKVIVKEDDSTLNKISNTNIFKQLMIKLDHDQLPLEKKEKEDFDKNAIKIQNNMDDELPRFGNSNKKIIDANRYDSQGKERLKSDKGNKSKSHSFEELNQDQSVHSNHKQGKNPVFIQNPNNTMTKNESQNDDSLFKCKF